MNMTEQEKMEMTKLNMRVVRANYERLESEYEVVAGSHGLAAVWGRVGGHGNRIAKPTQRRALSAIELEERKKRLNGWFECIRGTYFRLIARDGKSPNLWRHQQMVARAIQLYVFERADAELLALLLSGPRKLSRQYVSRVMREAVAEVMRDAEAAGLFEQTAGSAEPKLLGGSAASA